VEKYERDEGGWVQYKEDKGDVGGKGVGRGSEGHGQGIGSSGNKVSKKFFLPASGLPTPLIPLRYSGAHCQ